MFELLERVSSGDLTAFKDVNQQDDLYTAMLYAIPATIKAHEIQQHIPTPNPVWLFNRALLVERETGDVEDALTCLEMCDHPTAKQVHRDMLCFKHIMWYFEERALLSRKLTFAKVAGELARLPRLEQRRLALYLAEQRQCNVQLLVDAFGGECDDFASVELMEEIFG